MAGARGQDREAILPLLQSSSEASRVIRARGMRPRTITCAEFDCGQEFMVPVKEQLSLKDRGWAIPRRCPNCRRRRKLLRGLLPYAGGRA
jgi:hypothetical protein